MSKDPKTAPSKGEEPAVECPDLETLNTVTSKVHRRELSDATVRRTMLHVAHCQDCMEVFSRLLLSLQSITREE